MLPQTGMPTDNKSQMIPVKQAVSLEAQLAAAQQECARLRQELQLVKQSMGWKLVDNVYGIIAVLFPQYSWRHLVLDYFRLFRQKGLACRLTNLQQPIATLTKQRMLKQLYADSGRPIVQEKRIHPDFVLITGPNTNFEAAAPEILASTLAATDADLLYSDAMIQREAGGQALLYRPQFALDLFLSQQFLGSMVIVRRSVLQEFSIAPRQWAGITAYIAALTSYVVQNKGKIQHIAQVLYAVPMDKNTYGKVLPGYDRAINAKELGQLQELTQRTAQGQKVNGQVLAGLFPGSFRLQRKLMGQPLVSIIIPFKDQPQFLQTCVTSITTLSTYQNWQIILADNQSSDPAVAALIKTWVASDKRISQMACDYPFNFAQINNEAVNKAQGDYVILLNNDIEIQSPDWIESLLEHAQRDEVGAVGAKLLYPDDSVQHGGVIMGIGGVASHVHVGIAQDDPGYCGRASLQQPLSAVTAACLMIARKKYQTVGGMDEALPVAFNDVDFCLRCTYQGLINIYTPFSVLYHHESVSRGHDHVGKKRQERVQREMAYFKNKHHAFLAQPDPYYNPHLTLERGDFSPQHPYEVFAWLNN